MIIFPKKTCSKDEFAERKNSHGIFKIITSSFISKFYLKTPPRFAFPVPEKQCSFSVSQKLLEMIATANRFSTTVHSGQWLAFLGSLVSRAKQVTSGFKIPGVILAWLWLSQKQNYPHAEYITNPSDDYMFLGLKKGLKKKGLRSPSKIY